MKYDGDAILGLVVEAVHILQRIGISQPDDAEAINAAILALAQYATQLQGERDELLEALTEVTNQRRESAAQAERLLATYRQERGRYRDAGDLECQLDEAVGERQ